ncbi:unnamed protein product [Sphagnum jensenii]|uniref:Ubiquitin carboxyl-terminal hydrolase n=1 Tax=Sphagnum jensenii TaxID=128206 RepID=A0ABP1B2M4_9BRYO
MVVTQQLMVATQQQLQGLRSLGLVARPGRRGHIAIPISWNGLIVPGQGKGLAMFLTLLGVGSMGALLALRYATGASAPISFPWSEAGARIFQSKQTLSIDSQKQQQQQHQQQEEEQLTVPGLQNVGNNCFLNVVLQALASSNVLVSFMEECTKVSYSTELQPERLMMPLAGAVYALLKELAQSWPQQRTANPCPVMLALGLYAQHFDLATQQDAAEALAHLAAGLQEEREDYLQAHQPIMQSLTTVLGKHPLSSQLLQSWLHWPLEGTLASSMACQRCGFQFSTQFQFFNDLPLLPLRQADGNIIEGCTLEDCLDQFTAPEWVASVNCSHCAHIAASHLLQTQLDMNNSDEIKVLAETIDKCSCDDDCACEALTLKQGGIWNPVHTNASKCLQIGRSPEVLCLQIQRAVMNNVGDLKKLMGHVAISMVLDLFPYTVAAQEAVVKNTEMRSETQGDSLLQMLRQRSLTLSHIRMLQGAGYRSSLLNPESGLKGGSKLDEQESDVEHSALVESPEVAGEAQSGSTPKPTVANGSDSDGSNGAKPDKSPNSRKLLYELLSVVVHYGTPQSGHYTVYRKVRLPKQCSQEIPQNDTQTTIVWFKVSDTTVLQVEEQEVQTANASLVFYERIKG